MVGNIDNMEKTSCGNQKLKESLEEINNLSSTLLPFSDNAFKGMKGIFIKQLKVDYELEKDILQEIYILEEKFSINFRPLNWPRGYRFESMLE